MPRTPAPFPLHRLPAIVERPHDFRLLERIPLYTEMDCPVPFADTVGDEEPIILLDTETTGGSASRDKLIELGMVRVMYSPSAACLTSLDAILSLYDDPGKPIPSAITELTGITDDMVRGHRIDERIVRDWLADDPLIVAHNAQFDRSFFEKRFPSLNRQCWACSAKNIRWHRLGFESRKLEYLLLRLGWFYDAHRAATDCLAMVWLFHQVPEAVADLWLNGRGNSVVVRAHGATYQVKDLLKAHGYRWQASGDKHWWKEVPEARLVKEKDFLDSLYEGASRRAHYEFKDARDRHR